MQRKDFQLLVINAVKSTPAIRDVSIYDQICRSGFNYLA